MPPSSSININVMVNGNDDITITPATVDLSATDGSGNPKYAQPCTLNFNLAWAQNLTNKPFRFLKTTEDAECGIDITAQNGTEPTVATEFSWPTVSDNVTSVSVTDNNTGAGTYNFCVTVKDSADVSHSSDPSIKNRN